MTLYNFFNNFGFTESQDSVECLYSLLPAPLLLVPRNHGSHQDPELSAGQSCELLPQPRHLVRPCSCEEGFRGRGPGSGPDISPLQSAGVLSSWGQTRTEETCSPHPHSAGSPGALTELGPSAPSRDRQSLPRAKNWDILGSVPLSLPQFPHIQIQGVGLPP